MMLTTPSEGSPKVKDLNMNKHILLHIRYICLFSIPLSTTSCSFSLWPKSYFKCISPRLQTIFGDKREQKQESEGGGTATHVVKFQDGEQD